MRWSVASFINSVNSILEGVFVNDWLLEGFETKCVSITFLQRKSEFPCGFDLKRPSPSATSVLFCIRMADLKWHSSIRNIPKMIEIHEGSTETRGRKKKALFKFEPKQSNINRLACERCTLLESYWHYFVISCWW